jgi:DNA-binding NarL/FixJ family response regulator
MEQSPQSLPVVALVRDLLFATKISSTAQALSVPLKMVRDPAQLAPDAARCLIVDLNLPGAIAAAAGWKAVQNAPVVGFVSHVDTAAIQQARSAGIDRVIARSQFVQILPQLLTGTE